VDAAAAPEVPHGGGGASTGRVRSNSTRKSRPSGRDSSYTKRAPGSISIAHTFVTDALRPSRSNSAMDSASTGNSCRVAVPVAAVSPPYIVTASGVPSSCRWSCFSRSPSPVRVSTQVRERSSPTWNGIFHCASPHSRTCITSGWFANGSGVVEAGWFATMRPA
jgi:hypothetical protein